MTDREREAVERLRADVDDQEIPSRDDIRLVLAALEARAKHLEVARGVPPVSQPTVTPFAAFLREHEATIVEYVPDKYRAAALIRFLSEMWTEEEAIAKARSEGCRQGIEAAAKVAQEVNEGRDNLLAKVDAVPDSDVSASIKKDRIAGRVAERNMLRDRISAAIRALDPDAVLGPSSPSAAGGQGGRDRGDVG